MTSLKEVFQDLVRENFVIHGSDTALGATARMQVRLELAEHMAESYIQELDEKVPEITQKEVDDGIFSPHFAAGWNKRREQDLRFLRDEKK